MQHLIAKLITTTIFIISLCACGGGGATKSQPSSSSSSSAVLSSSNVSESSLMSSSSSSSSIASSLSSSSTPNSIPITAWIGEKDSLLSFPDSAIGMELYRSNSWDCDWTNLSLCNNASRGTIQETSQKDNIFTLTMDGNYLLKNGEKSASLLTSSEVFSLAALKNFSVASFKNKLWIIGGNSKNDIWSSSDGINWNLERRNAEFPPNVYDGYKLVTHQNKLWLFNGGNVWVSDDAIHWVQTAQKTPKNYNRDFEVISFNNLLWYFSGAGLSNSDPSIPLKNILTSADGITWTPLETSFPIPDRINFRVAAFKNKIWLIGGTCSQASQCRENWNTIWSSDNGINWQQEANIPINTNGYPGINSFNLITFNNRLWLLGGKNNYLYLKGTKDFNHIWSTSDGITWTQDVAEAEFPAGYNSQILSLNDQFFIIGDNGMIGDNKFNLWISDNLISWKKETAPLKNPFIPFKQKITELNNKYYAMDRNNTFSSSNDGIAWKNEILDSNITSSSNKTLIAFNNKLWLIGGLRYIETSTNNYYVAQNDIWSSNDGTTWQLETKSPNFSPRVDAQITTFQNKLWIIGGETRNEFGIKTGKSSDIWSSTDGINWNQEAAETPLKTYEFLTTFIINNQLWLIAKSNLFQFTPTLWVSADGVQWQEKTSPFLYGFESDRLFALFNGEIWMLYKNPNSITTELWSLKNGVDWKLITKTLPFNLYDAQNNQGSLYGNATGLYFFSDKTWRSLDGIEWRQGYSNSFEFNK